MSSENQKPLALKTALSTPMPLKDRVLPIQAARPTPNESPKAPSKAEVRLHNVFLPKRHAGHTTYTASANAVVTSSQDVPPRASELTYSTNTKLAPVPFDGTTTQKSMSSPYAREVPASETSPTAFYSRVRQAERVDDDCRHAKDIIPTRSGASKQLRCSAIVDKREHDGEFSPPKPQFGHIERAKPSETSVNSFAKNAPNASNSRVSALPTAQSSMQREFRPPVEKAGSAHTLLESKVQSRLKADRALVGSASTADLFAGTGKDREEVTSGFMGHVPSDPSNVAKIKGDADVLRSYSKCFVTVTKPSANSQTAMNRAHLKAEQK